MHSRSPDDAGGALVEMLFWVLGATIVVLAIAGWFVARWGGRLVVAAVREVLRVYGTRASGATGVARMLQVALAALGAAWLVAGLLILDPATRAYGIYLAAWGLLAFALVILGCELRAGYREPESQQVAWDLEEYLARPAPAVADHRDSRSPNGRAVGARSWRW